MSKCKSALIIGLVVLSLIPTMAIAAKKNAPLSKEEIANIDRTQSLSVYPLAILIGRFGLSYSFQVSDHIALSPGISGSYLGAGIFSDNSSMFQIGPWMASRFFLSDTAFNTGWYVEPAVGFSYTRVGTNTDGWSVTGQAVGGYAWYWNSGFTLNLGAGIAHSWYSGNIQGLTGWVSYPHPTLDFAVGYAF